MFYKIYKNKSPKYVFKLKPEKTHAYATGNVDNTPCLKITHHVKNSFFPSTIIEWNNLDVTLRNSKSFVVSKNSILKFIRPSPSNVWGKTIPKKSPSKTMRKLCLSTKFPHQEYHTNFDILLSRLIMRLRVGTCHLREHKFKRNLQDCLNPVCSCCLDIESTSHFLLHCPTFNDERYTLLSTSNKIDCKLLDLIKSSLSQTLLYGNTLFYKDKNTLILNSTIEYILSTERFEEPLI